MAVKVETLFIIFGFGCCLYLLIGNISHTLSKENYSRISTANGMSSQSNKDLSEFEIIPTLDDKLSSNTRKTSQTPPKPSMNKTTIKEKRRYVMSDGYHINNLRKLGMESTSLHTFKSRYIIDPFIYDEETINFYRVPGKRKTKVISCFNCPKWFETNNYVKYNRDFKACPFSECSFDITGINRNKAELLMFFPKAAWLPVRSPGQIWAWCTWESPFHYGYPAPYSSWKNVFNWTITYSQDANFFAPNRFFAWRDSRMLMTDSQYMKIASFKNKTAAWFVSNCKTESGRWQYIQEMSKYIDIDIFGTCSKRSCGRSCLRGLNDTYKFYLGFENSLCKDYVTEKLFRNFDHRLQIVPVVRGGFDYHKFLPPNTFIDASDFNSPRQLSLYLKELANDTPRYAAMLKEKDKLVALNMKFDWCELCEKLHTNAAYSVIDNIKKLTHYNTCWH